MAIQHRRGVHNEFDPTRLVAGEWAVVLSGDPSASDGRAAYVCFGAGIVKRVAVYEDMLDWLSSIKDDTIVEIIESSMAEIREEYGLIRSETEDAEAARVLAEQIRVIAENARVSSEMERAAAETSRASAEASRAQAEEEREEFIDDIELKLDSGFFDGATFTPAVNDEGVLFWTNDKGKPNPDSVSVVGPKGADGAVTSIGNNQYCFEIINNNLYLYYGEDSNVPNMEIRDDGHLYVELGEIDAVS